MKVKVKRIDKGLPLPEYKTKGSVACDIYSRTEVKVAPHSLGKIPGNVVVDCPSGYMFMVVSRSSTPARKGLLFPNGVGIGDQDFCGPEDEWNVIVYNFTDQEVIIDKGERVAQILFFPVEKVEWEEVEEMTAPTRGGIGSTGA